MILTVCANPSVDSFWSVDQLKKGTTNRSRKETYYPGGKGIHTALALNELGEEVTTLGFWGGQTGRWLQDACKIKGIETIGPMVKAWNRICITVRSDSGWNETELLGHGLDANHEDIKDFDTTYTSFLADKKISAVLISGSVPGGFRDDVYSRMVNNAKDHNIPAFLDTSGVLLDKSLDARPHGIHINHKEGRELSGKQNVIEIVHWLRDYCKLAAVTAGAEGLYLAWKDELYHVRYQIDKKDIVSTIGAGDCLMAGLAHAYFSQSNSPEYWARFATACGSANCIHPQLGMLEAGDVDQILDQVHLENMPL